MPLVARQFPSSQLVFSSAYVCTSPLSCSMVINCVPTAKRRGEMLVGYRKHLRLGGHLFLMLPLLCLTKSTQVTRASFAETLTKAGFQIRASRDSPKVAFFCATAAPLEAEVPRAMGSLQSKRTGGANARGEARNSGEEEAAKKNTRRKPRGSNDFAITL